MQRILPSLILRTLGIPAGIFVRVLRFQPTRMLRRLLAGPTHSIPQEKERNSWSFRFSLQDALFANEKFKVSCTWLASSKTFLRLAFLQLSLSFNYSHFVTVTKLDTSLGLSSESLADASIDKFTFRARECLSKTDERFFAAVCYDSIPAGRQKFLN